MKKLLKPFLVIAIYLVVIFLFAVGHGIFSTIPESVELLPKDTGSYRWQQIVLSFCDLFFAAVATGIVTGFSWSYAKEADVRRHKTSAFMLPQFRTGLIVCTVCVMLFILFSELVKPVTETKQLQLQKNAVDFAEYSMLADQYQEKEQYVAAQFYASRALALNPDDQAAKERARLADDQVAAMSSHDVAIEAELTEALSYLEMARKAFEENDYWNAHYYATLAEDTSPRDDETKRQARELASAAWNYLGTYTPGVSLETEEMFHAKKKAYEYYERGDVLQSYYAFNLLRTKYPKDLDIEKYYEASKAKLESMYFYTDETDDLRAFETAGNVQFSMVTAEGQLQEYKIAGITVVGNTGQMVQYLRGLEVTTYTADGGLESVLQVPYAKMSAQTETFEKGAVYRPFLLLESVNRETDSELLHIRPYWEKAPYADAPVPSYLFLDMRFDDFTLIRQASYGADLMPIMSLLKFVAKADSYGFSSEVYRMTLILRMTLPLFVLMIMIYLLYIGWSFRLGADQPFKTWWVLMFPLFTFVMFIARDVLLFGLKIVVYALCGAVPSLALWIVLITGFAGIFLASVWFMQQRSE